MAAFQEKVKFLASHAFLDNLLQFSYKCTWHLVLFLPEGLTAFYPKSIASRTDTELII